MRPAQERGRRAPPGLIETCFDHTRTSSDRTRNGAFLCSLFLLKKSCERFVKMTPPSTTKQRLIKPIMGSRARPVDSALCRLDSKSNECAQTSRPRTHACNRA